MAKTRSEKELKSFADRIDRLDEEIRDRNADKAVVFAEVKAVGFDPKALKAAIKIRRRHEKDGAAAEEADAMLDIYVQAISGQPEPETAPTGSAGPANGNLEEPRVHVHAHEAPLPPHDPETGEVEEDIPAALDRREGAAA